MERPTKMSEGQLEDTFSVVADLHDDLWAYIEYLEGRLDTHPVAEFDKEKGL